MTVKDDGSIEKMWVNQQTTDRGRPLDLHSISIKQHPRHGDNPMVVTQIELGEGGLWTTNLGNFTSDQLYDLHMTITNHLTKTGYYS